MTKRMLIDATHAEETRVVVLDGSRLEDFDVETSTKRQLKGNIYLAKIVRVEPSLQAAFVEYGGGRHGFLAFGEIHPDYYQIPVADRKRLLAMQAEEAREEAEAEDAAAAQPTPRHEPQAAPEAEVPAEPDAPPPTAEEQTETSNLEPMAPEQSAAEPAPEPPTTEPASPQPVEPQVEAGEAAVPAPVADPAPASATEPDAEPTDPRPAQAARIDQDSRFGPTPSDAEVEAGGDAAFADPPAEAAAGDSDTERPAEAEPETEAPDLDMPPADMTPPETVGGDGDSGDGAEEARERRTSRFLRNYRIQEVIRRRQILLVQVVKEERGTKGAALTTYISLAGRYCVLMPNSPRGGGISRKITSAADRRRLKEITAELDVPDGMGLIVRTAGANRPKPEIKRDCEYLMRLWDDIREHTLRSVAPSLIYEEASLIKRAIRDVYSRDIDEVIVDGEEGWKQAHDFMRMLMPSHAKKVQLWRGGAGQGVGAQPLFSKHQVEAQLDAMLSPTVQLRSGGYLVINQAEALVAIDVNSGRSTRERGIEETALRTNLEAADEVARQLRLRDLAGLIVIDFIDMESKKNNAAVERRMKDALKTDRARIQVGHISHFGLMEMSRQRLRPSLAETSLVQCPHCGGIGFVRSTESSAIHVLRAIEDEGAKGRAALIRVEVAAAIVLYLFNHKRDRLAEIEARYAMRVQFEPDDKLQPPELRIERLKPQVAEAERAAYAVPGNGVSAGEGPASPNHPVAPAAPVLPGSDEDQDDIFEPEDADDIVLAAASAPAAAASPAGAAAPNGESEEQRRRRRRRRRRGGRRDQQGVATGPDQGSETGGEGALEGGEDDQERDGGEDFAGDNGGGETVPIPEPQPASLDEPVLAAAPVDPAAAEQPSVDAEALEAGRARRRGRRGGRRRRRGEPGDADSTAEALPTDAEPTDDAEPADQAASPTEPVALTPSVPDPAHRTRAPRGARKPAAAPPVYDGPTPANPFGAGPFDIFDMLDDPPPPPPEPPRAQPEPQPEPAAVAEVEPTPVETPVVEASIEEPPPVAAPAPEPPAAEPTSEPLIKPIVIGAEDTPPAERKRGWWRR
jgi:ribonuclease E